MSDSYSQVVLEHFRRPMNRERLANANATADGSNPLCGDRIRIEAHVEHGAISRAAFTGDACAICVAAASVLSERVHGMKMRDVMAIADHSVIAWLESPLPPARRRCATLPLDTLHRALASFVPVSGASPVVLAAGSGSRFGGEKMAAMVDGEPLLRGVVRAYAAVCGRVTVVVRHQAQFADALEGLPVSTAVNRDAEEGIASSIRAGVSSCSDRPAVMIALGDEPRVDRSLVSTVMDEWQATRAPVVVPRFDGVLGHPVLFDRQCFADLLALDGDVGARAVIQRFEGHVRYVDVGRAPPLDIDTPDDLRKL